VTPRLKAHFTKIVMHFLFPEYFQRLRAKKYATNAQNGHRLFLGQLQIDSNMRPLRFITFPV
jgi:hypothetical protein